MKLLFALLTILVFSHSLHAVELHLSPRGNDTNDGTTEKPFATLERTRDEIRAMKKGKGLPALRHPDRAWRDEGRVRQR
ncbi:MAG: hypothetical protein JNM65_08585 [Verrucomicrobiaceae bacterium]|nr:hypothetical protein [Verrucomicrobiaceae bacterium]